MTREDTINETRNNMKTSARMQAVQMELCEYNHVTNTWDIELRADRTLPPHQSNTPSVRVVEAISQSIRITLAHDLDAGDGTRQTVEVAFGVILSGFALTSAENYATIRENRPGYLPRV